MSESGRERKRQVVREDACVGGAELHRPSMRTLQLGPLLRDAPTRDVAMDQGFAQAMLIGAAAGFATGKEARDGCAFDVDDLTFAVDPQAPVGIVPNRTDRGGIERRLVNLVHGRVFSA